ncbi:hypothetical protein Naga_102232g1 [Nannochloropsis gaditana]|uniref:Uncharacterized protein n=1 Tax=Nannochloropsis gaditana TaxID=72520 RepID=W7TAQ6_9STRA|nr:hypothetical protein Naga_102232g1 [Nannochloropsis gaditana]
MGGLSEEGGGEEGGVEEGKEEGGGAQTTLSDGTNLGLKGDINRKRGRERERGKKKCFQRVLAEETTFRVEYLISYKKSPWDARSQSLCPHGKERDSNSGWQKNRGFCHRPCRASNVGREAREYEGREGTEGDRKKRRSEEGDQSCFMTVESPSGFPSNIQHRHTPPHVFIKLKGKKNFSL